MGKRYIVKVDNAELIVEVEYKQGNTFRVKIGDRIFDIDMIERGIPPLYSILINGASYEVIIDGDNENYVATIGEYTFNLSIIDEKTLKLRTLKHPSIKRGPQLIKSTIPGKIISLLVKNGQRVNHGQSLVVIEAMKMENELHSPTDGFVSSIEVAVGATIEAGAVIMKIENEI